MGSRRLLHAHLPGRHGDGHRDKANEHKERRPPRQGLEGQRGPGVVPAERLEHERAVEVLADALLVRPNAGGAALIDCWRS